MGERNEEKRRPARPGATPAAPGSAVLTPPTGLPAVAPSTPAVPGQRTPSETVTPPARTPEPPAAGVRTCTCGHPEEMHEHYRSGDDCGACGPRLCASFRDAVDDEGGLFRRVTRRLRG